MNLLKVAETLAKRLMPAAFGGESPHRTVIEELHRSTSPNGKRDALLTIEGGRNVALLIVPHGKSAYGLGHKAVFIHCEDPAALAVTWIDDYSVRVEGKWDAISPEGEDAATEQGPGYCVLTV